jgi:gliding motility-associated-like protein
MIHWAQTGSSGLNNDHWGIDNVTIMSYVNCTPYWYDYSNLPASNDPAVQTVNVTSSGTYNVTYTNGTDACSTSVTITLPPCGCPTATVSGGGTYCVGNDIPDVTIAVADGQYPITVTYAIDGVTQPPLVLSQPDSVITDPVAGVYTILAVTDPSACTGTFSGTATVVANPSPILTNFTGGDIYCAGETVADIIVEATGNGTLTLEYTLDGVAQTPLTGSSPFNLGNAPGVYELTLLGDAGCSAPVTGTQTIVVNPIPTATAGTTTPLICEGEDVMLTSNTSTGTYSWSGPNGFTSTSEDPTITGAATAASGTYTLTVTENGCTSPPSTIDVAVNPLPNVTTNADMTICEGTDVTLAGQGAITYSWDNGVTNGATFTPGVGTVTYTVTGTQNGCSASASVTVTVLPLPVANANTSVNSGYAPLAVTFLNASSNATSYAWDFGNGSNSTNTNPLPVVYSDPGTYAVILTASNGVCDSTWTDSIVVISYPAMTVHVPNVFSPNGDGSNDEYVIDVQNGKAFEMTIINRWGNPIITITQLNNGWDGKINGKDADDGVYFVKFRAEGLDQTVQEGHTFFHLVK